MQIHQQSVLRVALATLLLVRCSIGHSPSECDAYKVELQATFPDKEVIECRDEQYRTIEALIHALVQTDVIVGLNGISVPGFFLAFETFGSGVTTLTSFGEQHFTMTQMQLALPHYSPGDFIEDMYYDDGYNATEATAAAVEADQLDWNTSDMGGNEYNEENFTIVSPTGSPSAAPSSSPSDSPSSSPSGTPSVSPSTTPSASPSDSPSVRPSDSPSASPSGSPSASPSSAPSTSPSDPPGASIEMGETQPATEQDNLKYADNEASYHIIEPYEDSMRNGSGEGDSGSPSDSETTGGDHADDRNSGRSLLVSNTVDASNTTEPDGSHHDGAAGCPADWCGYFFSRPCESIPHYPAEEESLHYHERITRFQERVADVIKRKLRKWARDTDCMCLGNSWELIAIVRKLG